MLCDFQDILRLRPARMVALTYCHGNLLAIYCHRDCCTWRLVNDALSN
jgi:hypothetical protein